MQALQSRWIIVSELAARQSNDLPNLVSCVDILGMYVCRGLILRLAHVARVFSVDHQPQGLGNERSETAFFSVAEPGQQGALHWGCKPANLSAVDQTLSLAKPLFARSQHEGVRSVPVPSLLDAGRSARS